MDLHTRLERFGGPVEAAGAGTIEADVVRGQRAVRRRRTALAVGGSTFAVAAIMAAAAFTGAPAAGPGAPGHPPAVTQDAVSALKLVQYSGPQSANFTVDKVPEGFFVQSDDDGGITLAPVSAQNPGPDVDPSKSPIYDPENLQGKIGIYLEQKSYRGELAGERLTVGGFPAILHQTPEFEHPASVLPEHRNTGPTWQLILSVHPEVYATLQFDLPLSREQMLELGAGLHVRQEAILGMVGGYGGKPGS